MPNNNRTILPHLGDDKAIRFSTAQVNELVKLDFQSDLDWYQSLFRPFGFMTLNSAGKYSITGISSTPQFFREYDSCVVYTSAMPVKTGTRNIEPIHSYLSNTWCQDDLLGDCYKHFWRYDRDGDSPRLTEEGQRLLGVYEQLLGCNYKESLMLTNTLGRAFPDIEKMLNDDISYEERNNYINDDKTPEGWVAQWIMASQDGHKQLNVSGVINDGDFGDDGSYNGDIVQTIKQLIINAKPTLRQRINSGNYGTPNRVGKNAMIIVDCDYYSAIVEEYDRICNMQLQNCMLITKKEITHRNQTKDVYYIKGMPVIPVDALSGLNHAMNGTFRFIAIVSNEIINMGNSVGGLNDYFDSGTDEPMAIKIWRQEGLYPIENVNHKTGKTEISYRENPMFSKTHALIRSAILNPDLLVGAYAYDATKKVF